MENSELLTPQTISEQKFGQSFKGYNIDEVDEFLEKVYQSYQKLWDEKEVLKKQPPDKTGKPEESPAKPMSSARTLSQEKDAGEFLANARQEAEKILREARNLAQEEQKALETFKNQKEGFVREFKEFLIKWLDFLEGEKKPSPKRNELSEQEKTKVSREEQAQEPPLHRLRQQKTTAEDQFFQEFLES